MTVKNTGSNVVKQTKVCLTLPARERRLVGKVGCVQLGSIEAGRQKKAGFRISARCTTGGTFSSSVKASASNAGSARARAKIMVTECRPGPPGPLPYPGLG